LLGMISSACTEWACCLHHVQLCNHKLMLSEASLIITASCLLLRCQGRVPLLLSRAEELESPWGLPVVAYVSSAVPQ
ncbi:Adenosylcobinamide-GDP ribazoletransferase, partial [Clarias magur]